MLAVESVCAVIAAEQRDVKCRLRTACELLRCEAPTMMTHDKLGALRDQLRALRATGCSGSTLERFVVPRLAAGSASEAKAVDRRRQTHAVEVALLNAVQQAVDALDDDRRSDPGALPRMFRLYCNQVLDRLEDEALLLVPLARRSLQEQQWGGAASAMSSQRMAAGPKAQAATPAPVAGESPPRMCPLWECPPGEASELFRCRAACTIHVQRSTAAPETRPARRSSSAALASVSA
jgi:hypothetical protein